MEVLSYLSQKCYRDLEENIEANRDRYETGDFRDILDKPGAVLPTKIEFDGEFLAKLNDSVRAQSSWDNYNALRLFLVFEDLYRNDATFDRIWTKLCHDELLVYSRLRWPGSDPGNIRKHFFCNGRTGYRDDNAIGRLWWMAKIVLALFEDDDYTTMQQARLFRKLFISTQERQDIIERPGVFGQPEIARSIIVCHNSGKLQSRLREFMPNVRRRAAGRSFAGFSSTELDSFIMDCE